MELVKRFYNNNDFNSCWWVSPPMESVQTRIVHVKVFYPWPALFNVDIITSPYAMGGGVEELYAAPVVNGQPWPQPFTLKPHNLLSICHKYTWWSFKSDVPKNFYISKGTSWLEWTPRWHATVNMKDYPDKRQPWWKTVLMTDNPDERASWWKTVLMTDHPDERLHWWHTTLMKDCSNDRWPRWKTTLMSILIKDHSDERPS